MAALVIDTCGEEGYVAVVPTGAPTTEPQSERHLGVRATQEQLLPAIGEALTEAGVGLKELEAVAVVSGPGSFTGVRIGLATAKGLGEAAGLPLVVLSRLKVLANAVSLKPVWALLQAGRGDVYAASIAVGGSSATESHEIAAEAGQVLSLERAIVTAGQVPVVVCEEALRSASPQVIFVAAGDFERSLRKAASEAIRTANWADLALTDALYLRVPDAELALRARQG